MKKQEVAYAWPSAMHVYKYVCSAVENKVGVICHSGKFNKDLHCAGLGRFICLHLCQSTHSHIGKYED